MLQPKLLQGQLSSKIMEAFWEFIINRFPLNQPLTLMCVYSYHPFSYTNTEGKTTQWSVQNTASMECQHVLVKINAFYAEDLCCSFLSQDSRQSTYLWEPQCCREEWKWLEQQRRPLAQTAPTLSSSAAHSQTWKGLCCHWVHDPKAHSSGGKGHGHQSLSARHISPCKASAMDQLGGEERNPWLIVNTDRLPGG